MFDDQGFELGGAEASAAVTSIRRRSWRAKVERKILVRLEETQLADALGGNARGGEVGDAAGLELEPDIGDIDGGGQHGETDGTDLADGRLHERKHDIEIVNHEVEHDIDVERARGKDGKAVRLEKHGR